MDLNKQQGAAVAAKIARIMADAQTVKKDGTNSFFGYDYASESAIVRELRKRIAAEGLGFFPSVKDHSVEEIKDARGKATYRTTVTLEYALVDSETGDRMTTVWVGQGMDSGDKGYYKAYTGAQKYFLMKTFLLSTGDDPEQDEDHARQLEQICVDAVGQAEAYAFFGVVLAELGAPSLRDVRESKIAAMLDALDALDADARAARIRSKITPPEPEPPQGPGSGAGAKDRAKKGARKPPSVKDDAPSKGTKGERPKAVPGRDAQRKRMLAAWHASIAEGGKRVAARYKQQRKDATGVDTCAKWGVPILRRELELLPKDNLAGYLMAETGGPGSEAHGYVLEQLEQAANLRGGRVEDYLALAPDLPDDPAKCFADELERVLGAVQMEQAA